MYAYYEERISWKNETMREGWKIKIEFGDIGDELD
jgi:hypothetical protein